MGYTHINAEDFFVCITGANSLPITHEEFMNTTNLNRLLARVLARVQSLGMDAVFTLKKVSIDFWAGLDNGERRKLGKLSRHSLEALALCSPIEGPKGTQRYRRMEGVA